MIRCNLQNMLHIAATCISRSNCIVALSQRNLSSGFPQLNNYFHFGIKAMGVSRFMILRVSDKSNSLKSNRAHILKIRLSRYGAR